MKRFIFLSLIAFSTFAQIPKKGEFVPDFNIGKCLNNSAIPASMAEFRGKIVILDFWATWCKPCIVTHPLLEKLQDQFRNDLVVLAISDESPEVISKYIQSKPSNLSFVVDSASLNSNMFGVMALPHTVVIDRKGKIQAITHPSEITDGLIQKLVDNQEVATVTAVKDFNEQAFFEAKTSSGLSQSVGFFPYQEGQPTFARDFKEGEYTARRIYLSNMTLKGMYEYLYRVPMNNIIIAATDPFKYTKYEIGNLYCFEVIVSPEQSSERFQLAIDELNKYAPLKSRVEKHHQVVKVLKVVDKTKLPPLAEANDLPQYTATMTDLAQHFTDYNTYGMQVVDETGLSARYIMNLDRIPDDIESLEKVFKKIGLKLTEEAREVEVLVLYE